MDKTIFIANDESIDSPIQLQRGSASYEHIECGSMAAKNPVGTQALEREKTCGVWSFDRRLLAVQYVFKAPNASSELDFNVRRACSASPYEVLNLGELLSLVPTASFFSSV